jgi:hypothetical protein
LKFSNLIGSDTVNVPLAITTSEESAAASIVLVNEESLVNVTLPPLK